MVDPVIGGISKDSDTRRRDPMIKTMTAIAGFDQKNLGAQIF
jgi:hypothetical protein